MDRTELLRLYRVHHNPALALHFDLARCPVEASATGTVVVDEDGAEFLDMGTAHGIFGLGHCHPRVHAAVLHQLERLATVPYGLAHAPGELLGARLAELLPGDLDRTFFASSGSEGVEVALRTALLASPGRTRLVAMNQGYHGKTLGALSTMGMRQLREPFEPLWPDVVRVPYGDAEALAAVLGPEVAAVILEPVLGGGTIEVPPPGYLREVRALCDRHGALLIADEVQTGLGRTGKLFGIERDGIVPDAIVLSKTLTGGHVPLAVTVVRAAIVERALAATPHACSYASHPVSSPLAAAAGLAALEAVVEEALPARAERLGAYLGDCLATLAEVFPELIVDTPGIGLMMGIRVRNRAIEHALWLQLQRRGFIVGLSLNSAATTPVLRVYPPLTVERRHVDRFVEALYDALRTLSDMAPRVVYSLSSSALRLQFRLPQRTLAACADLAASIPGEMTT